MPVETIECQIVQAQLGRYLSGDALSNEALGQLEDHIGSCPICRDEVAVRRASLQALLGATKSSAGRPEALIGALREAPMTHAVVETPATSEPETLKPSPTPKVSRPLLYGSALALVLVAMSYIGNNPTSLFGERATTAPTSGAVSSVTAASTEITPEAAPTPISLEDWSLFGLEALIPFDSADASALEDWQWFAVSENIEDAPTEVTTETTSDLSDWEMFGLGLAAQGTPEPEVAAAPPTSTPRSAPIRRPARRAGPNNTVRIYAPGQ